MNKNDPLTWSEKALMMNQIKLKDYKILALENRIDKDYVHKREFEIDNYELRKKIEIYKKKIKKLRIKNKMNRDQRNPLREGPGKGDQARNCHNKKFRKNYDKIKWKKKK